MSPTLYTPLLPPRQTELEAALVRAAPVHWAPDVPEDEAVSLGFPCTGMEIPAIRTLHRPEICPDHFLPWLAWQWDVPAWPSEADDRLRRTILTESLAAHREAGTLAGFRRVGRLAGFPVRAVRVSPDTFFPAPRRTVEERNAWLRRLPQLRIYPYRVRRTGLGLFSGQWYAGSGAPIPVLAGVGERAVWYRDGQERTIRSDRSPTGERIAHLPGRAVGLFGGRPLTGCLVRSTAGIRCYTLSDAGPYAHGELRLRLLSPGLAPVTADHEWVSAPGRAVGVFISRPLSGCLAPSTAWSRIYRRWYLADPDIRPERRGRSSHAGAVRLGMPTYHARLSVDCRSHSAPRKAFCVAAGVRFPVPSTAPARLSAMRAALGWPRAARDRVWIATRLRRPASAGHHYAGGLLAGQYFEESA